MIVVALAIVCGLSAAWGMNQLGKSRQVTVEVETAPLVVARMNVSRGQMVTSAHLKIAQWPADMLPEGALSTIEEAEDRATSGAIMIGEPVLDTKLAAKGAGGGLAVLIPSGMRGYTIHTSQVASSVAGLVLPGNVVDVMLNLSSAGRGTGAGKSSTTLLQAVEILAVNQDLEPPAESRTDPRDLASVTLLVSPDQVTLLDLAQSMGQLTLSLRNPDDKETADTQPALLADILMRQYGPVAAEGETEGAEGQGSAASGVGLVELDDQDVEPEVFRIRTLRGVGEGEVRVVSYENVMETQTP